MDNRSRHFFLTLTKNELCHLIFPAKICHHHCNYTLLCTLVKLFIICSYRECNVTSRDELEELIAKNQDDADLVGAYKNLISSEQMLKEFAKGVCT